MLTAALNTLITITAITNTRKIVVKVQRTSLGAVSSAKKYWRVFELHFSKLSYKSESENNVIKSTVDQKTQQIRVIFFDLLKTNVVQFLNCCI